MCDIYDDYCVVVKSTCTQYDGKLKKRDNRMEKTDKSIIDAQNKRIKELFDELREKNEKIDKLLNKIGQLEYNK